MAHSTTTPTTTTTRPTAQDMGEYRPPIPNPHHRKIDLQSHADLTYLQQNLAQAAREKLDIYFPLPQSKPQPKAAPPATVISLDGTSRDSLPQQTENEKNEAGEVDVDPLRAPVTALIDEFLRETYTSASQSITVNGIDASSLPPSHFPTASNPSPATNNDTTQPPDPTQEVEGIHYTYASFDRKLQKRMQSLYEEVESLTAQVASLRRETPKAAAERYTSDLEIAMAQDEKMWDVEQKRMQSQTYTGLELSAVRPGWNEDVKSVYEKGVGDLAILSGIAGKSGARPGVASLTETVGKAERARNVAAEFE